MEAASPARPQRRRRRRRPSWKAQAAAALYAGALLAAWSLVEGGTAVRTAPEPAAATPIATTGPTAPSSSDLALRVIANRSARSLVSVGESAGFVAWTTNGLTLVVTAKPAGGWATRPDGSVTVRAGSRELAGRLVRTDGRTGLGLVRVQGEVERPLWQRRQAAPVERGARLVAATPRGPAVFGVTESRHAAIWGLGARTVPGAPVLDESGRLVGVATTSRIVPIGRACGKIRRC